MKEEKDPYKPDHEAEYVPCPKWIRVFLGGKCIADSKKAVLVRESEQLPVYYFPPEDVETSFLIPGDTSYAQKNIFFWTVKAGDSVAERAAWSHSDRQQIKNYISFQWDKMDAWFEEDEEVYVHARDPFKRIDTIASSRHVRVMISGQVVAETERPVLLFEPGLPIRYYIPKPDLRMDLLVPGDMETQCPYKGTASHISVKAGGSLLENIAWFYPFPTTEMSKIKDLVSFYQEKLDEFYVDGKRIEKVKTPWS